MKDMSKKYGGISKILSIFDLPPLLLVKLAGQTRYLDGFLVLFGVIRCSMMRSTSEQYESKMMTDYEPELRRLEHVCPLCKRLPMVLLITYANENMNFARALSGLARDRSKKKRRPYGMSS